MQIWHAELQAFCLHRCYTFVRASQYILSNAGIQLPSTAYCIHVAGSSTWYSGCQAIVAEQEGLCGVLEGLWEGLVCVLAPLDERRLLNVDAVCSCRSYADRACVLWVGAAVIRLCAAASM